MRRKKRALTLIEIMIVIVLIGLIGSVIGVNMKGSLDEGRAFKTKQAQEQIADILMLQVAQGGYTLDEAVTKREELLAQSGLVKNAKKFLQDGWGQAFEVRVGGQGHDKIVVTSAKLKAYEAKKIKASNAAPDADEENS